ncbi:MAG: glycosyltransferase family 4 protein [Bacteroidales bacterium]|nr:glycosyltransferase family 4 protein [Bacteroidales bacterium]
MKILFIRYKKSKNILEGGEQGSQKNYNVLSQLVGEDNITTYYIHDENLKKSVVDYAKGALFFPFNYYFGLTPKRVNEIVHLAQSYDVVFIDRSVFGIVAKRLKETGYKGRIISFFHNVEVPYFEAKLGNKPGKSILLKCIDHNDRYACQYSDKTIALNPRDDDELFARYGKRADVLIPVAFKDKYQREQYSEETTGAQPLCLFLGAYFPPNNEGIVWFVQNVLPHVNIRMKVVGKGMARLKAEEPLLKDIEVISDAPELLPYFEKADIMVLPIFKGSGMKVKTCESLMYGKNIIATDEAFEGYEVDYDRVGGKCNTAEAFIARIKDFETTPRPRFNAYSRQMFLEKYSEEAVVEKFREVLFGE